MVEYLFIVKTHRIRKNILFGLTILVVVCFLPAIIAYFASAGKRFPLGIAPEGKTAIVFGAGLYRDGSPSAVLRCLSA